MRRRRRRRRHTRVTQDGLPNKQPPPAVVHFEPFIGNKQTNRRAEPSKRTKGRPSLCTVCEAPRRSKEQLGSRESILDGWLNVLKEFLFLADGQLARTGHSRWAPVREPSETRARARDQPSEPNGAATGIEMALRQANKFSLPHIEGPAGWRTRRHLRWPAREKSPTLSRGNRTKQRQCRRPRRRRQQHLTARPLDVGGA